MKVEITKAQLKAIMDATDNLSAMIGTIDQDFNNDISKIVKLVDRFLNKNGFKRKYK